MPSRVLVLWHTTITAAGAASGAKEPLWMKWTCRKMSFTKFAFQLSCYNKLYERWVFFFSCVLRCCHVHDKCYASSRRAPGCTAIADLPYILVYGFTCSNQNVTCSGATVTALKML